MKQILYILSILLILTALNKTLNGQGFSDIENLSKKNVVRVITSFKSGVPPETGFGFIIAENDNLLYISTALHVVKSSRYGETEKIEIFFESNKFQSQDAIICYTSPSIDFALLKITKPISYYWSYNYRIGEIFNRQKVWNVVKHGEWTAVDKDFYGVTIQHDLDKVLVESKAVERGSSGSPIFGYDGILGMVIDDNPDGTIYTATNINTIFENTYKYLNLKDSDISKFPFFSFGINLGWGGFVSSKNKTTNSVWDDFEYGLEFEVLFNPFWSISLNGSRLLFKTQENEFEDNMYLFKNDINTFSTDFHWFLNSTAYGGGNSYLTMGIALIDHNPQISVNGNEWIKLVDYEEFVYDYSTLAFALNLGMGYGFTMLNDRLILSFDFLFRITNSKYLNIDLDDPFSENKSIDVAYNVSLGLAYVFRGNKAKVKIIKNPHPSGF